MSQSTPLQTSVVDGRACSIVEYPRIFNELRPSIERPRPVAQGPAMDRGNIPGVSPVMGARAAFPPRAQSE
jgi:hypothetical protein